MNTEYVLWFAILVVVAGAALVWLAVGVLPDIPTDPEAPSEPAGEDGLARHT